MADSFLTPRLGVVLVHGKNGHPGWVVATLAGAIRKAGWFVAVPELPWSRSRYIDRTYEDSLDEIGATADGLRRQGATRIVVAGHSMGANAALAFGAVRGGTAGVAMLAAGHVADQPAVQAMWAESLMKAGRMVEQGKGAETARFTDLSLGSPVEVSMRADVYQSFFSAQGLANMPRMAGRLDPETPLLFVMGNQDKLSPLGREYIFDQAPVHPLSRYVLVEATHMATPTAAAPTVLEWLETVARQAGGGEEAA